VATIKELGRFVTPADVVNKMLSLIDFNLIPDKASVLEPACYDAPFLSGLQKYFPDAWQRFETIHALDIDPNVKLPYYLNKAKLIHEDFLLWNPINRYDLILGNPPYGIPGDATHYPIPVSIDRKKQWKKTISTWQGKYNLYAAFIEKAIRLLKPDGQLTFVVPGTFMFLDEFQLLRRFIAHSGTTNIYYVGKNVFKGQASVSVVFLHFIKSTPNQLTLYDWQDADGQPRIMQRVNDWNGSEITFSSEFTREIENNSIVRIHDLFAVHISPRTPEIKRALAEKWIFTDPCDNSVPILTSKHLKHGRVAYEISSKYFINIRDKTKLRKFFDFPRLVVSLGFHDGRLAAAYDHKAYPWMGDVYHLIPKNVSKRNLFSNNGNHIENLNFEYLSIYLSSYLIGRYIKEKYRDFIYHINKQQLMQLPVLSEADFNKLSDKHEA